MKPIICLFILSSVSLFFFQACKKDNVITESLPEDNDKSYINVPEALWDYFHRFEDEAQERGFQIDLNALNISAEIIEIDEDGVAGSCSYGTNHPNHIIIDLTFWNQTSDLFKEMIIFHELGHCSLFRGHREDSYSDGTCVSIMRSGLGDCLDNYRVITREKYLDELFEED